jgi:hypothetical protein
VRVFALRNADVVDRFLFDDVWEPRQNCSMGQAHRPICPECGAPLVLALPPDGTGKRVFRCVDCDKTDPLKTDKVIAWLNSELRPPE